MQNYRPKNKPFRLTVVLAIALMLGGTGAALASWSWVSGAGASTVDGGEGSVTIAHESVGVQWPVHGEAAIAVGDGTISANSDKPVAMASISKVVTVLMVLEEMPLAPGESGPWFDFDVDDDSVYLTMLNSDVSALPVPVGGALSQYQMLEGVLIGSACNYVDRLVSDIWGANDNFVAAARSFLERHGLSGITMVEPTGLDPRNTAAPADLIALARLALANPVVAEIVSKPLTELPGAGVVENTNDLLADPGVVGLKTGTLDGYNLLSAKDVLTPDGAEVRVYAVVLNQPTDEERFSASRELFDQISG